MERILTLDEEAFLHEIYSENEKEEFELWISHIEEDYNNNVFRVE